MATKAGKETGSALDRALQRDGLTVQRELDAPESVKVNERIDLEVGQHFIARLVNIRNQSDNKGGTFKVYVFRDFEGEEWDMLGSADLDNRREFPRLVGNVVGIERTPDQYMNERISAKKRFRVVDLGNPPAWEGK